MKALGCIVEHDADYAAIDRDYKFVRFLHQNILRLFRPTGMQIPSKHGMSQLFPEFCYIWKSLRSSYSAALIPMCFAEDTGARLPL